jgi:hypothetical protein
MIASPYISSHGLFIGQFFFSLIGATFSIAMLVRGEDASIYLPVLSGIIGVWVPSPLSAAKQPSITTTTTSPQIGSTERGGGGGTFGIPEVTIIREIN